MDRNKLLESPREAFSIRIPRFDWKGFSGLPTLSGLRSGSKLDLDRFALFSATLYLGSFVIDSPLRWSLSLVGLASLIYLRDLLVLLLIFLECERGLRLRQFPRLLGVGLAAIGFHLLIGMLFVRNIPQVLFGFKVTLPLLLGLLAGARIRKDPASENHFFNVLIVLWTISLVGVILEACHIPMPWKGFSVEIGDVTISGNRAWTAAGINRLAGFGRASFDTSLFLLLFFASVCFRFRFAFRWILAILSLAGIVLTTTKVTVLAALAGLGILFILSFRLPLKRAIRFLVLTCCLAMSVLPPLLLRPGVITLNLNDPVIEFAFASFFDRIYNTWPNAFALLDDLPVEWLGRGIGGIGASQTYFEPTWFSPGDNMFVYAWVATGAASLLYMGFLFLSGLHRNSLTPREDNTRFLFTCLIFVLGATMNVVESATSLFLIGFWICKPGVGQRQALQRPQE